MNVIAKSAKESVHDSDLGISIIGIGGGGGNTINNTIDSGYQGARFIAINTDSESLESSKAQVKIQIGTKLTNGLGSKGDSAIGRQAALEDSEAIRNALKGSHMAFIVAGLGGGTGTGAAPIVAGICKEMDVTTIAVVTKPFSFEGEKRMALAQEGADALTRIADMVVVMQNDLLRKYTSEDTKIMDMLGESDKILPGLVNYLTELMRPSINR